MMELMWFRWLGSKQASPRLELLLSVLEPPPGRPLIYTGDARRSTESHTGSYSYPGWSLSIPNLQYKLYISCRFTPTGSKPTTGLGPSSSHITNEVNPAQAGRFTPSGNIPNRLRALEKSHAPGIANNRNTEPSLNAAL